MSGVLERTVAHVTSGPLANKQVWTPWTATATDRPDQRVALVTGGAGVIGSAIAGRLAPDRTVVVLVDLSEADDVRRAAHLVLERYGRCDVLMHCAGAFDFTSLAEFDLAAWRSVQAVNVEAHWLAKAFTPGMAERRFGRIVFITSDTF